MLSQTEIIEGCISKNPVCQKLLYDKYKDAMFTLCVRLCGCKIEAQDVFQESFVEVFASLANFRNESTLGAWMKTIFTRKAYKNYRKKLWVEDITELDESELIDWGNEINTEHLEIAMKQLPDGFRMVLVLIEIEGYKHREVAEMLGISIGTSKSQLFYAKKKLKETLLKMEADARY